MISIETQVHMHEWYFKVFLTYAEQLEAYDAEVKSSVVINNITVLVLFCCALH